MLPCWALCNTGCWRAVPLALDLAVLHALHAPISHAQQAPAGERCGELERAARPLGGAAGTAIAEVRATCGARC